MQFYADDCLTVFIIINCVMLILICWFWVLAKVKVSREQMKVALIVLFFSAFSKESEGVDFAATILLAYYHLTATIPLEGS